MIINQLRKYFATRTTSVLYVNGVLRKDSVLEDAGRPAGVKIDKETCIPEGCYRALVTHSPKFGKEMIILFNVTSDHSINRGGVKFTGVRVHSGTSVDHTEGCLLYPPYEGLKDEIKEATARGEDVFWIINEALK